MSRLQRSSPPGGRPSRSLIRSTRRAGRLSQLSATGPRRCPPAPRGLSQPLGAIPGRQVLGQRCWRTQLNRHLDIRLSVYWTLRFPLLFISFVPFLLGRWPSSSPSRDSGAHTPDLCPLCG